MSKTFFPLIFLAVALLGTFACETPQPKGPDAAKLNGNWLIVGLKKDSKTIDVNRLDTMYMSFADGKVNSELFGLIDAEKYPSELAFQVDGSDIKTTPELPMVIKALDEQRLVLSLPNLSSPNGELTYAFELTLDKVK